VLTTYLESIAPPAPKGMLPASVPNPHRQPEAK